MADNWLTRLLPALVLATSGCSTGPANLMTGSASVSYERSNAFSKQGYNETAIGPDRYRITVGGRTTTPRAHLEKIATIRAAEIGMEQRQRYFKIENTALTETCSPATEGNHKSGPTKEVRSRLLTAEVVYAKSAPDATFAESKKTFEDLRPTLDTDQVPPELSATPPSPCI